jgi:hypothetical protein
MRAQFILNAIDDVCSMLTFGAIKSSRQQAQLRATNKAMLNEYQVNLDRLNDKIEQLTLLLLGVMNVFSKSSTVNPSSSQNRRRRRQNDKSSE